MGFFGFWWGGIGSYLKVLRASEIITGRLWELYGTQGPNLTLPHVRLVPYPLYSLYIPLGVCFALFFKFFED